MTRSPVRNFSAGPGALPVGVLREAQEAVGALPGTDLSILCLSHRTARFRDIVDEAEERLRRVLSVPPRFKVLFLQGGGTLQFSMVPLAMLPAGEVADHVVGGYWSRKAVEAASYHGRTRVAWDGAAHGWSRLPRADEPIGGADAAYLHYVSNETVEGLQLRWLPRASAPLVCDMSSDFLSAPVDVDPFSIVYAHAQKNFGPAGVTVALVGDDVLERVPNRPPPVLDYREHAAAGSILHTPPVFAIYVVLLVLRWLEDDVGGLERMAAINREKARVVREALAASEGFYRSRVEPAFASDLNVTFRCPTPELDARFVAAAERAGLIGTEGHRSTGGLRVSLYNGVTLDDARAAAGFLAEFAQANRAASPEEG